jgi:tripartite-type tricarboxylate transporter receptor subunit TctC
MRFFARLLVLLALPLAASAQGWKPTQDVEFVVPFGLGGGAAGIGYVAASRKA